MTSPPDPAGLSEEELAAVVAAIEAVWPRPVPAAAKPPPTSTTWRFSGRWWSRSPFSRGDRPWVGPAS